MFKPFFVHRHTNRKFHKRDNRPRGYTLLVRPKHDDYRNCIISGTWCSKEDNFCREIGRENAMRAEQKEINKRDLPKFLNRMNEECGLGFENFNYIYKYLF